MRKQEVFEKGTSKKGKSPRAFLNPPWAMPQGRSRGDICLLLQSLGIDVQLAPRGDFREGKGSVGIIEVAGSPVHLNLNKQNRHFAETSSVSIVKLDTGEAALPIVSVEQFAALQNHFGVVNVNDIQIAIQMYFIIQIDVGEPMAIFTTDPGLAWAMRKAKKNHCALVINEDRDKIELVTV